MGAGGDSRTRPHRRPRHRGTPGRRLACPRPPARTARQRQRREVHHPAQDLRHDHRGVRPRPQRPTADPHEDQRRQSDLRQGADRRAQHRAPGPGRHRRVALATAAQQLDSEYALLSAIPTTNSGDEATSDLVKALRDKESSIRSDTGISFQVTGQTAVNVDVSRKLSDSLLTFAIVVVSLCLLILLVVFRSLVVPVKATVGFLLSVAASFGAVVAVFQWGWAADVIDVARTGPGRSCPSCRSSSWPCSSDSPWTTRCSSSPASTRSTPTAVTHAGPS
ncbi:MMPL family transporter [Streptomyces sp. CA-249302]|uniref:MMPL family transporter n=1 Tax=Streptomyces sp. CA-249302 TaxID=3240058 RepID=UPI003D8B80DF